MKMRFILAMVAVIVAMMFAVNGCGDGNETNEINETNETNETEPPEGMAKTLKGPWIIYQRDGNVCILFETGINVDNDSNHIYITTDPGATANHYYSHHWDIADADDRRLHWFEVYKLKPDTHYKYTIHYRATIVSGWSKVSSSFHTAPDKVTGQLKFFGFGDTKSHIGKCSIDVCKLCDKYDYIPNCDDCDDCDSTSKLNSIAGEMNTYSTGSREAAFVIHTGDIVPDGGNIPERSLDPRRKLAVRDMWRDYFFNVHGVKDLLKRKGIFTTVGNHDFHKNNGNKIDSAYNYWRHFPYHEYEGRVDAASHLLRNMYYKFDWGPAEFYSLTTYPADGYCGNSTSLEYDGAQYKWLESNLAKYSDRQWKIVFLHMPVYSPGSCNQKQLRDNFKPLFDKYGVDLVLQGHEHYYSRVTKPGPFGNPSGIPYLVLGGGGASLSGWYADRAKDYEMVAKKHHYGYFEINGDVLRTKILDIHSQEFDTFTLDKTPVANFEVDHGSGFDGGICQFKSLSTGNVKELEWQFPNGTSSSDQDINKSCEDVSPGVITLTAKSVFHSNTATISTNSDKILNISFTADKTTGPIGTIVRFTPVAKIDWEKDSWRIGDRMFDIPRPEYFDYHFNTNGKFRVARAVEDNASHQTKMVLHEFICIEPYSRFTFLPQEGKMNEEIRFHNESVGDGLTYNWNFGDGVGTSTDQHPIYTYSDFGSYPVRLDITDKDGLTDSYLNRIIIAP